MKGRTKAIVIASVGLGLGVLVSAVVVPVYGGWSVSKTTQTLSAGSAGVSVTQQSASTTMTNLEPSSVWPSASTYIYFELTDASSATSLVTAITPTIATSYVSGGTSDLTTFQTATVSAIDVCTAATSYAWNSGAPTGCTTWTSQASILNKTLTQMASNAVTIAPRATTSTITVVRARISLPSGLANSSQSAIYNVNWTFTGTLRAAISTG